MARLGAYLSSGHYGAPALELLSQCGVAESAVADEAAAEREEGLVDVGTAVVAHEQPFELMQPGEGALDDPAVAADAGAVLGFPTRDLASDPAPAELASLRLVVVGAVGGDTVWSPTRPADATTHRRHAIDERDQLRDVVAIAARERPGERDPRRIDEEVVLGAVSGSINRARARRGAPFFACT